MKTRAQADKESLQANWFDADTSTLPRKLHLRAYDILSLIDAGKTWQKSKPLSCLPVNVGHVSASVRLVVAHCTSNTDDGKVSVLMKKSADTSTALPAYVIDRTFFDPIKEAIEVNNARFITGDTLHFVPCHRRVASEENLMSVECWV